MPATDELLKPSIISEVWWCVGRGRGRGEFKTKDVTASLPCTDTDTDNNTAIFCCTQHCRYRL